MTGWTIDGEWQDAISLPRPFKREEDWDGVAPWNAQGGEGQSVNPKSLWSTPEKTGKGGIQLDKRRVGSKIIPGKG